MILGQPVTLKAVHNLKIRKEDGQYLAEDGETVIATSYWLRRLDNGDVVETRLIASVEAEEAAPATKVKG